MAPAESLKRLPFDLYGRYRLAADFVEAVAGPRRLRLVEVGAGPASIEGFLENQEIVVVDATAPSAWHTPVPDLVLADGGRLPFADATFDVVCSLDAYEHLLPADRGALLAELMRVASGWVLLACPCATPGVAEADAAVLSYVRARFGEGFETVKVLTEHLSHGHPDPDEIAVTLRAAGAEVARVPSGRLDRWLPMMLAFFDLMALGRDDPVERLQAWYNGLYSIDDRREPAYRQAFLARLPEAAGPPLPAVVDGLLPQAAPEATDALGLEALRAVVSSAIGDTAEAHAARVRELEAELADARADIEALTIRAEGAETHVRALLEFRDRVLSHPAARLRRGLKRTFGG